jgi:hypothetical protein
MFLLPGSAIIQVLVGTQHNSHLMVIPLHSTRECSKQFSNREGKTREDVSCGKRRDEKGVLRIWDFTTSEPRRLEIEHPRSKNAWMAA